MRPEELAEEVKTVLLRAVSRVGPGSIGEEQYAQESEQKFERVTMDELFEMYLEEFEDIINYAVMLHIRVRRMQASWKEIENASVDHSSGGSSGVRQSDELPSNPGSFIKPEAIHDLLQRGGSGSQDLGQWSRRGSPDQEPAGTDDDGSESGGA